MIPVLWLAGPPGVGKTAAAWEIYHRLQRAGADPAYVDVDQLGICYPPPTGDADRHALKARNVAALRATFAAAGARALIVSGVVDAGLGPDIEAIGGLPVTIVRLLADADQLRARLRQREGSAAQHEAAVDEGKALDRCTFANCNVDTSGLSVAEVATRVLGEIGDWPPGGGKPPDAPAPGGRVAADADGDILAVTGASGVGKSTIAFRAYLDLLGSGRRVAYVDIGQLGFCDTGRDDHALQARNLAAVWTNFHAAGARLAVVTGRVPTAAEARVYDQALSGALVSWRRLRVGDAELTRRILSRGGGGSWAEPGDPLRERPPDELLEVAERALAESRLVDQHNVGQRVDIEGLDVAAAAAALLAGWPPG